LTTVLKCKIALRDGRARKEQLKMGLKRIDRW
jgi:hypothetical protein